MVRGPDHRLFSTYCRAPRSNGSLAYLFQCSRCLCSCPWAGCCSRGNIAPEDKEAPRKPLAKRARALIWSSPTQLVEPLSTPYLHLHAVISSTLVSRLCFSKVLFLVRFLISLDISVARVGWLSRSNALLMRTMSCSGKSVCTQVGHLHDGKRATSGRRRWSRRHRLAAVQATEFLVCDIYHIEPIKDFSIFRAASGNR